MSNRDRIACRAQRGFTMMETLAVVSILVIVAIIAIPNVVQMQKAMRLAELDAKAQQIYNAAQYNLTSLESTKKLYRLVYETHEDDTELIHQALASKAVGGSGAIDRSENYNSDAAYLSDGHDPGLAYGLYAAGKSNETVKTYLLTSEDNAVTQAVTNGEFWIEFSPTTGEVYSVFYFEPGAGGAYPSYVDMSSNARSDKAWRADNKVGYYGGKSLQVERELEIPESDISAVGPGPGGEPTFADLKMSIVNKEELYVHLAGSDLDDPNVFEKIKVTVSVKGLTREPFNDPDTHVWTQVDTWTRTYAADGSADEAITYESGAKEADVIIDSMRNGLSIIDLYPDLVPGVDIDVTVKLSYDGRTVKELSFSTNSLYESITDDTAVISSLRHLHNLDLTRIYTEAGYTYDELQSYNWNNVRFYNVSIADDIEFDGTKWADDAVSLQSRQDFVGNGYNPLASYEPMALSPAMESRTGQDVFDGNNHTLRNFVIARFQRDDEGNYVTDGAGNFVLADAGANTGMVGTSKIQFQNLRFVNPVVVGGENTGVLAGTHAAGTIRNVHIYSLVGEDSYVSGGNNVGGLAGNLSSGSGSAWISLEGCSSTVDVYGGSYVGGLVGNGGSWSAPNGCYVGYRKGDEGFEASRVVTVAGTGDAVGGMFGTVNKPVENNHVLANVSGSSYVGGFVGYVDSSSAIRNCEVGDPNGLYQCSVIASGNDVGGVAGYCAANANPKSYQSYSYVNKIEGQDNVGGYAGELAGEAYLCGARGGVTSNGLTVRVSVSGRDNVGGFAGKASNYLDGCYAAVDVGPRQNANGSQVYGSASCYGGFAGRITGGANIRDSYSSGNVLGDTNVGGFIGLRDAYFYNLTQELGNLYTTSNVSGRKNVGGFIGNNETVSYGYWHDLASYGKVTRPNGGDSNSIWGFIGATLNWIQAPSLDAVYLRFSGYNDYSLLFGAQPSPKNYRTLSQTRKSNPVTTTHPFSSDRLGRQFPYEGVAYNGTVLPHYGDWYYE